MKNNELDLLIKKLKNQLWFDYIKTNYPVEVDKIINEFSARYDETGIIYNPNEILKYGDLVRLCGTKSVQDLKRFFYNEAIDYGELNPETLTIEELRKIDFVIDFFPPEAFESVENLTLTDIIRMELNSIRGQKEGLVNAR